MIGKKNESISHISLNVYEQFLYNCIMPKLDKYKDKKLHLLFQAQNDGFSSNNFHQKCDGKSPTIAIIIDTKNNIYGGFTDISWESSFFAKYKADMQKLSLIFVKPENRESALVCNVNNDDKHIYCSTDYGPTYGDDLVISCDCNNNLKSYWNQGNHYGDERLNLFTMFCNDVPNAEEQNSAFLSIPSEKFVFKVQDYQVFLLK